MWTASIITRERQAPENELPQKFRELFSLRPQGLVLQNFTLPSPGGNRHVQETCIDRYISNDCRVIYVAHTRAEH